MLTENPLTEVPDPNLGSGGAGERLRRLERRRRLVREELLAVALLLVFLAVTVAVLATQWLASGPSAGSAGAVPAVINPAPHGGAT